jgi:hypothetical protein
VASLAFRLYKLIDWSRRRSWMRDLLVAFEWIEKTGKSKEVRVFIPSSTSPTIPSVDSQLRHGQ